MDVSLRWCHDSDWERIARIDGWSFGVHYEPADVEGLAALHDMKHFLVAELDGRLVGATGAHDFEMTSPGGGSLPVRGVTWVSVVPGFRRRGILRALLTEQHQRFVDDGIAASILLASESAIYGRFGYGPATVLRRVELDRRRCRLRPDVPRGNGARLADADEAKDIIPLLHERWRRRTPGALSRRAAWWERWWTDPPPEHDAPSARFYVLHEDGYATYRVASHWGMGHPDHLLEVEDLFAATPQAYTDLWSFFFELDLFGRIATYKVPPGDPLPFLLTDPRQLRTIVANDGVWVRPLDVPAALEARSYAVDGVVVLEVVDGVWDRGGVVRLESASGVSSCDRSEAPADLVVGVGALGSVYLGGHRLTTLADAGLVEERSAGALMLADAMFASERAPQHGTPF